MRKEKTISETIREAFSELGINASNKQIKKYVLDKYKRKVISQTINSAIGTEYSRQANKLTANQLADTKKFVAKTFDGDANGLFTCLNLMKGLNKV
jgi:hypothetical protein